MHIPGYVFTAARIVSKPGPDSPLRQIHLGIGDVITRLDGIPVTGLGELERHYGRTYVRYIKQGTTRVRNGEIDLDDDGTPDRDATRP